MSTEFVGYDRGRIGELGRRIVATIAYLDETRSDDPCASEAIASIRHVSARLETEWLPLLRAIAGDTSLLDYATGGPAGPDGGLAPLRPSGFGGALRPPATTDGELQSDADAALLVIIDEFEALDTNGDGQLSWDEISAGSEGGDASVADACAWLVEHPLAFANTALAESNYAIGDLDDIDDDNLRDGGWGDEGDGPSWQGLTLSPTMIAGALEQNRHQRTLARPDVFVAADGADDDGQIDGRVSRGDLEALLDQTDDPDVIAMCRFYLGNDDAFRRIDRETPETGGDGTIAYDQLYELGQLQGALAGLPDPTIPDALQGHFGDAVPNEGGETQFIHYQIDPQPGRGQVVMALYIPAPTAGVTPLEDLPGAAFLVSEGNDRGPDPTAHPSDSKLHLIVDYETGIVTVRIPPSVGENGGVSSALPIVTDMGEGGQCFGRLTPAGDSNHVNIDVHDDGTIEMNVAVLNADKRVVAPWLNGTYVVVPAADSEVRFVWMRDPFPAMEAYHIYPGGAIVVLADDDADFGAVIGLVGATPSSGGEGQG